MTHRKREHTNMLVLCNEDLNGASRFGVEKCWFRHTENGDKKVINKKETTDSMVIQKVVQMMEKITERILKIENKSPQQ